MDFETTVDLQGRTLDVLVTYTQYPFIAGRREFGLQVEPDEDSSIEIDSVNDGGEEILHLLSDECKLELEQECINHYIQYCIHEQEADYCAKEDYYDALSDLYSDICMGSNCY